jgi:5-methylthioadenosine/S-adenosylhomocysteine deaminase
LTTILIENGLLIRDSYSPAVANGAIAIQDDRIAAIGRSSDLRQHSHAEHVIDASGKAILPGLVNVHSHVATMHVKGVTEDRRNSFYSVALPTEQYMTPDDVFTLSLAGCIETEVWRDMYRRSLEPYGIDRKGR